MAWHMTAPSWVMRSASHFGTSPPWSGKSALPDLWLIPAPLRLPLSNLRQRQNANKTGTKLPLAEEFRDPVAQFSADAHDWIAILLEPPPELSALPLAGQHAPEPLLLAGIGGEPPAEGLGQSGAPGGAA